MRLTEPWPQGIVAAMHQGSRIWSLWDMINYMVSGTLSLMDFLRHEERMAGAKARSPQFTSGLFSPQPAAGLAGLLANTQQQMYVSPEDKERLDYTLKLAEKDCKSLELDSGMQRLERLRGSLARLFFEYSELESELRVLRECMEDDLKKRHFCYYRVEKAKVLIGCQEEWKPVITAFPSTKLDIYEANDSYALGLDRASVYHSMMILERGLKALSKALRVKYEHRNWQNIIDDIEDAIAAHARLKIKKTAKRNELLTFYGAAAKEFSHFKEAWRNHAAHGRAFYDENDSKKVLEHVREFMKTISQRLKEKP